MFAALVAASVARTAPLSAQLITVEPFARLGSEVERARRAVGLRDSTGGLEWVLRSSGGQAIDAIVARNGLTLFQPELHAVTHSAHPWGGNDGALRAGVGLNVSASTGLAAQYRMLSVAVVATPIAEENGYFQTIPYSEFVSPTRNVWANPFYAGGNSMDYPQRFGNRRRQVVDWEGRLALRLHDAARIGVSREQRWWGPGLQQALVVSNNAPAIPQVFLESASPLRSPVGHFSYAYMLGRLEESPYFDGDPANDTRSLSALTLVWEPQSRFPLLPTIGLTRAVMNREAPGLGTALDVFADAGRPWARPAEGGRGLDQITGLFARWRAPAAGAAAWMEWVRYEQPASFRDYLEGPGHAQGYTLGAEHVTPWWRGHIYAAAEFSYAEPSPSIRVRPVESSYVGKGTAHGWTHQGQMLGPWFGPAGSSQWARADYWAGSWRAGFSLGRLRRDANHRFQNLPALSREDVQLYYGLRFAKTLGGLDVQLEFTEGARLNHLFQSYGVPGATGGETTGVDLLNRSFALTISPKLPRPQP